MNRKFCNMSAQILTVLLLILASAGVATGAVNMLATPDNNAGENTNRVPVCIEAVTPPDGGTALIGTDRLSFSLRLTLEKNRSYSGTVSLLNPTMDAIVAKIIVQPPPGVYIDFIDPIHNVSAQSGRYKFRPYLIRNSVSTVAYSIRTNDAVQLGSYEIGVSIDPWEFGRVNGNCGPHYSRLSEADNQSPKGTAIDNAGNSDSTPPTTTAEVTPAANAQDSNNANAGNVNTESVTYNVVGPKDLIAGAIPQLSAAKTGDKEVDKKIDKAIDHIEKSLMAKLWVNATHLDPKYGHKVFYEVKYAVKTLQKLIKDKKTPNGVKPVLGEVINRLVNADKLLAEVALKDAQAYAGTSKKVDYEIAKSVKEFARAQEEAAKGQPDNVVDRYKYAWQYAQHAIDHANK